jgi:calcineurin-like phosphoesterase family protein
MSSLNCQNIYLLWGNHNSPAWSIYQREVKSKLEGINGFSIEGLQDVEIYPWRYKNMVFLGNYAEICVDGHYFIACHYPIYVWNYVKDGAKMVCGHSHYGLPFSQETNLDAKILDVGWDGYGHPLSNSEVLTIMNKKAIYKAGDHHDRPTNAAD